MRSLLGRATALALVTALAGSAVAASRQDGAINPNWKEASVPAGFTVAAVGDIIMMQPAAAKLERTDPALVKLLRGADVTFGNFEGTALDLPTFKGWPEALSGGGWLLFSPKVPADLRTLGFTVVNRANNHTTDFGVAGMLATDQLLDEAGIVHAGTGRTLSEARAPAYLTSASARVGIVGMASRFEANALATDPLGEVPGRPGVDGLRTTKLVLMSPQRLAQLAAIRDAQPAGSVRTTLMESDHKTNTVTLFGTKYRADPAIGDGMRFSFEMNEQDRVATLRSIRQAKQNSDFAIATIHAHEPGNYSDVPPDFMPTLARQAIDNGADMFIGHGPHQLRGIEIYKGKPIFYSLGNFFFTYDQLQPVTRDEYEASKSDPQRETEAEYLERQRVTGVFKEHVWFESALARCKFGSTGRLTEIQLYPVELHWDGGRDADRGTPRLASGAEAKAILERLSRLSKPYGTRIRIQGDVGIIDVIPAD